MENLWSAFDLKGVQLRNRVVMAPTVKFCINDPSGFVCDELVEHYRKRAASGTGLVIVEATAPTVGGKLHANNLGLWCEEQIPGMKRLADVIHQNGAAAILQLCYCGVSSKDPAAERTSASPEYFDFGGVQGLSHPLTLAEIREVEQAYRDSAVRAVQAGFDGVEIHCAHHKLYAHFLDAVTNQRTDAYGGSYENRARIVNETITAIREAVPQGFLIGLRMGVNLPEYEDACGIADVIEKAKPDYYHLSMNIVMPEERSDLPEGFPCNTVVYNGSLLRKRLSAPVILSNEISRPEQAAYLIENGYADLISLGRGMLADYDWTRKAKEGLPVDECRHCKVCMWRTDLHRCPAVFSRETKSLEKND